MAVSEILFKGLPFHPSRNQVFYIENGYDKRVNRFIHERYEDLKCMFRRIGMDFLYLPYLPDEQNIEAKVRYYAPYLSPQVLVQGVQSNALVPYIADAREKATLRPSFLFEGRWDGTIDEVRFLILPFDYLISSATSCNIDIVDNLMRIVQINQSPACWDAENSMVCEEAAPHPSVAPDRHEGMFHGLLNCFGKKSNACCDDLAEEQILQKTQEEIDDEQSLVETDRILRDLRNTVQKLRLEGVSLMAIHEFIDKQEPLSRMTITSDYRIFLPDYNNMEIEMGALPKAVYFLFLRYPEGIVYKHMPDYFGELLNIYKQLRPGTDEARLNLTITKVVNPLGNALNENIARIRKAFVEKFDEHLANNYIITGERGSQYSIPLDRNLITWEE